MSKIIEEAKKAIFDFDQSSKRVDSHIGLITPPSKDIKNSPIVQTIGKPDTSFDGS